jgi:hypothetical protein
MATFYGSIHVIIDSQGERITDAHADGVKPGRDGAAVGGLAGAFRIQTKNRTTLGMTKKDRLQGRLLLGLIAELLPADGRFVHQSPLWRERKRPCLCGSQFLPGRRWPVRRWRRRWHRRCRHLACTPAVIATADTQSHQTRSSPLVNSSKARLSSKKIIWLKAWPPSWKSNRQFGQRSGCRLWSLSFGIHLAFAIGTADADAPFADRRENGIPVGAFEKRLDRLRFFKDFAIVSAYLSA